MGVTATVLQSVRTGTTATLLMPVLLMATTAHRGLPVDSLSVPALGIAAATMAIVVDGAATDIAAATAIVAALGMATGVVTGTAVATAAATMAATVADTTAVAADIMAAVAASMAVAAEASMVEAVVVDSTAVAAVTAAAATGKCSSVDLRESGCWLRASSRFFVRKRGSA